MATTLAVFAHLDDRFVPAGLLSITETGTEVLTSSFRYGTIYLARPQAVEIEAIASAFRHLDEVAIPDLKKML